MVMSATNLSLSTSVPGLRINFVNSNMKDCFSSLIDFHPLFFSGFSELYNYNKTLAQSLVHES
jgi:hypothetical protein